MGGANANQDVIYETFARGDFVPHLLTDRDLVSRYGKGTLKRIEGGVERIYAAASCKVWLKYKVDSDSEPRYRIVEEITVSSFPLSSRRFTFKGKLCSLRLKGVALGDGEDDVLKLVGANVLRKSAVFAGRNVEELYVNPMPDETDLYYRIYLENRKVVAFSIGDTE
jgi:hypothetical protein